MKLFKKCLSHVKFVGLILLLIHTQRCSSQGNKIDPEIQKLIDDYVQDVYIPSAKVAGLGLAIIQGDDDIVYSTGYGLANIEKGIPTTNSTQFLIGSVTKSFTSLTLTKLLRERFPNLGEAVLDVPIRKLLPEFNLTLIDRFRSENGNVRDLLSHRMCLFQDDLQLQSDPFNSTEEIVYRVRYNREVCSIRSAEFKYNNQLYVMAGELIRVLANKPYAEALQDLLNELGMADSELIKKTDDFSQMPNRAMPYYVLDNQTFPMNPELVKRVNFSNAAGGLFSTPRDMLKYMKYHLLGKEEVLNWMRTPSNLMPGFKYKNSDNDKVISQSAYGLGLSLSTYDGWSYIQHSGYFPTYYTHFSLYPAKKLGIFTSSNVRPPLPEVNPATLHAYIFETLKSSGGALAGNNNEAIEKARILNEQLKLEDELERRDKKEKAQKIFNDEVKKALQLNLNRNMEDIVGVYGSGNAGDVEISEKLNEKTNTTEYYLQHGKWYAGWLEEETEGVVYKILIDTDMIQDDYATGITEYTDYAIFQNDVLLIISRLPEGEAIRGTFQLGLRSDLLPPIPWEPDSCGPEQFKN